MRSIPGGSHAEGRRAGQRYRSVVHPSRSGLEPGPARRDARMVRLAGLMNQGPGIVDATLERLQANRAAAGVPDSVLEGAADAVRFPRSLLRPALRALRSYRAATRGWSNVDRVMTETFFAELLAWSGEALEAIFEAAAPPPPPRKRAEPSETETAALWARLERRTPGQRLAMVEEIEEFQTRALAGLIAARSREISSANPDEARDLADLAHRITTKTSSEGNPVP